MQLTMPVKGGESDVPDSKALTLLLGKDSQVHYFFGLNDADNHPTLHTTSFSDTGLRQILLERQQQQPAPFVLIKAGPDAKYRDLVDVLDEMNITDQHKYALVDFTPADQQLLAQKGAVRH
jgi:biopolymer transport protein ExbD